MKKSLIKAMEEAKELSIKDPEDMYFVLDKFKRKSKVITLGPTMRDMVVCKQYDIYAAYKDGKNLKRPPII